MWLLTRGRSEEDEKEKRSVIRHSSFVSFRGETALDAQGVRPSPTVVQNRACAVVNTQFNRHNSHMPALKRHPAAPSVVKGGSILGAPELHICAPGYFVLFRVWILAQINFCYRAKLADDVVERSGRRYRYRALGILVGDEAARMYMRV